MSGSEEKNRESSKIALNNKYQSLIADNSNNKKEAKKSLNTFIANQKEMEFLTKTIGVLPTQPSFINNYMSNN